ncbi:hypothetical protein M0R72_01725 [Candidatus Pacearchaeota archaeon]|nr:hypothetical protein [Candidatus Pacearchaeota archaeon]
MSNTNPINDDPCFEHDILAIIQRIHDVSTGMGGDPCPDDFEKARWLQWKLSVWKAKTICPNYPEADHFSRSIRSLVESALEEFKARCCRGIYADELR